jgi:hypothetical protein
MFTTWMKTPGTGTVYTYDSQNRVPEIQRHPLGKNTQEDTCRRVN